jgi:hypothetical protein
MPPASRSFGHSFSLKSAHAQLYISFALLQQLDFHALDPPL